MIVVYSPFPYKYIYIYNASLNKFYQIFELQWMNEMKCKADSE